MPELGYLYVLANSAMPGLVKVGKTIRTPSNRADELSRVTGIPTPFIIVYEQLFNDCSSAERFVHTYLESRGFRVAANREFFNAPVNDVIRAIIAAPGSISQENTPATVCEETSIDGTPAWKSSWEQAEENFYGLGNVLQDHVAALRLYKQAIKLGCSLAHARVGAMYEAGQGTAANSEQAISYYKEGAKLGHRFCYWRLAILFLKIGNIGNAEKCAIEFLNSPVKISDEEQDFEYSMDGLVTIHYWMSNDIWPTEPLRRMINKLEKALTKQNTYLIRRFEREGRPDSADVYKRILAYLEKICAI